MPDLSFEKTVISETSLIGIAGLDEAGRGALAGPVVAGAVILPLEKPELLQQLHQVNDSKQLKPALRERLFEVIIENAVCYGIGAVEAPDIDSMGIISATKLAMRRALSQLDPQAQFLLIDGRIVLKSLPLPQQALIRGDSKSLTIASASILAKVTRDRIMVEMDSQYPEYGFSRHKGYGTLFHRLALAKHGPSPEHRYSFAPIRHPLL